MTKIEKMRQDGSLLYINGDVLNASRIYKKMINDFHYNKKVTLKDKLNDLQGIVNMLRYLSLHDEALDYAKKIFQISSTDYNSILTLSISYLFVNNYKQAVEYALEAISIDSDDFTALDILAEAYMNINDFQNAKRAGIQALQVKEKNAEKYPGSSLNECIVKPFNENDKSKNIISFSLFGDSPKYCENAIINAKKASKIYPHWSCRFYCGSDVPLQVIERLKNSGSNVVVKTTTADIKEMLFWRFLVMGDQAIDRYLVRDCDSVINEKEAVAVEEWIRSGKKFHILRDFYTHTDLILAGMFGGVSGIFEDIDTIITSFHNQIHTSRTHLDQKFLTQKVWPTIKNDVLIHDSCFNNENSLSIDFPKYRIKDKEHHIGKNEGAATVSVKLKDWKNYNNVKWTIFDKEKIMICTYHSTLIEDTYSAEIPTSYAIKLQNNEYHIKSDGYYKQL